MHTNTHEPDLKSRPDERPAIKSFTKRPNFLAATFNQMLFRNAVGPFLVHSRVEKNHAPETTKQLKACIQSWLLPRWGDFDIEKIGALDVLQLRADMADKNLSNSRQTNVLATLKLFLRFSNTSLGIPCLDAKSITLPRRVVGKVQYLTNEEIGAIRSQIDCRSLMGLRLRALFELLLASGMRISECLRLNRESIDRSRLEATIIGKGGRPRVVFFTPESLSYLDEYLKRRRDLHPALFVTTGHAPRRLQRGDIPGYFKALGQAAGVEKHFTPHLLRHTFCTNLRNNGADISLIKDLAGHRDIQTTARYYLAVDKELLRQAVRKYLNYKEAPLETASAPS